MGDVTPTASKGTSQILLLQHCGMVLPGTHQTKDSQTIPIFFSSNPSIANRSPLEITNDQERINILRLLATEHNGNTQKPKLLQ